MTYISDIASGKRVVTKRMKRKVYYDKFKSKSKAVGRTLNKNIKYMGKKIGSGALSTAKAIRQEQIKKGGFYKLHNKPKSINLTSKKVKYYKKKGKKLIPVYKKYRKLKRKKTISKPSYNYSNPFNLDF